MKSTYIIGEIGQNHNGSVDIAKLIVDLVSRPVREEVFNLELRPMDAVKMTKRDLSEELTDSQMNRPYDSPHSFGRTYGEHRAYLELTDEEHFDVYKHAKSLGLDFVETLCSKGCMSLLKLFTPDRLKVASRDLTNLPLLEVMAETKIPIILFHRHGREERVGRCLGGDYPLSQRYIHIALRVAISHPAGQPEPENDCLSEAPLRAVSYRFLRPYHRYCSSGGCRRHGGGDYREAHHHRPPYERHRPARLL